MKQWSTNSTASSAAAGTHQSWIPASPYYWCCIEASGFVHGENGASSSNMSGAGTTSAQMASVMRSWTTERRPRCGKKRAYPKLWSGCWRPPA
eukprot:11506835-Karenia_brevis.AAC.1